MSDSGINLDFDRARRLGFDEAMFCAGKTPARSRRSSDAWPSAAAACS